MRKKNKDILLRLMIAFLSGFLVALITVFIAIRYCPIIVMTEEEETILKAENVDFLLEEANEVNVFKALLHYGFPNVEIIMAQAVLETGHFKSRNCLELNNLFGLFNSRTNEFMRFDSWPDCVLTYKRLIMRRHREGEDYYSFLSRIRYAEDPDYEEKLRNIVNRDTNSWYELVSDGS